jgi:hypothetical protein
MTLLAHILIGAGIGFTIAALIVRPRTPPVAPAAPCYLNVAYELGSMAGSELYILEALSNPPKLIKRAEDWQPDPTFVDTIDVDQAYMIHVSYSKGRHDGWWRAADGEAA